MLKYRLISFPILIALLAVMVFFPAWGKYLLSVVGGLMAGMMFFEAAAMLEKVGIRSFKRSAAILGGFFLMTMLLSCAFKWEAQHPAGESKFRIFQALCLILMAGCFLVNAPWLLLLFRREKKEVLERTLGSVGVLVLCGIPVLTLALVYFEKGFGPMALFFVMMVTKSMDTGGYIFGLLSNRWMRGGNHKIVPSISPKKSWEGTAGGVVLSVAVSLLFCWLNRSQNIGISASVTWYIVSGVVLALGSFAGDLTESALKRTCGIKDSGHWIPGMGGAFDVLDSFLYNGLLFWLLTVFLR